METAVQKHDARVKNVKKIEDFSAARRRVFMLDIAPPRLHEDVFLPGPVPRPPLGIGITALVELAAVKASPVPAFALVS